MTFLHGTYLKFPPSALNRYLMIYINLDFNALVKNTFVFRMAYLELESPYFMRRVSVKLGIVLNI